MNEVVVVFVPAIAMIVLIFILVLVAFNSIYDIFSDHHEKKAMRARPFERPHITVIITVNGDIQKARDCLLSLQATTYKKYDVVVANNQQKFVSYDDLGKIITGLKHPGYYYKTRISHRYNRLINEAYKRSKKGDIAVLVDSGVRFTNSTLQRVSEKQSALATGNIARLRVSDHPYGFAGVMSSMTNSLASLLVLSSSRIFVHRSGGLMPRTALYSRYIMRPDSSHRLVYEPSIVVHGRRNVQVTTSNVSRIFWMIVEAGFTVLFIYASIVIVFEAMNGKGIEGFMVAWSAAAFAGLSLILFDTRTNLRHKAEAIFCVGFMPILIALAFIISVIEQARAKQA